ncbi:MAG: cytochrome c biogenesis protein [Methanophagales archaeon]|nr:cytochrome c biogenesis protein CcsA [Methanophagales archaeon]MCW3137302.1 cytochrome c biogenesis protein [Methanophagales archaeon]
MKRDIILVIGVILSVGASYMAYVSVHPVRGDIYFSYTHVPAALVCYLAFFISLVASIMYLKKRARRYDMAAEVLVIIGLVYGIVALISGAIWANAAWGLYWNWDPKQTTTLILWIAYAGYIAVKYSISEVERRAVIGAVYNVLAFSLIPLTFLSVMLWQSLHPRAQEITLSMPVKATLILNLAAASLIFAYLIITTYSLWSLEDRVNVLLYRYRYKKGGA